MYSRESSEVASSRFAQDDRIGLQRPPPPPQSRLALPGFYADLMQKYPRAFELQLHAEQQRLLSSSAAAVSGGRQSFDPGPIDAPQQSGWTGIASGCSSTSSRRSSGSSRDELAQIIQMLASSLAKRESGRQPQHEGEAARSDAPQLRRRSEAATAWLSSDSRARLVPSSSSNNPASVGNGDLRARLQRNKEVMHKLLGDRSPFRPPGPACAELADLVAQGKGPSDEAAAAAPAACYDSSSVCAAGIASPSTRRLPRTRLVSVDSASGAVIVEDRPYTKGSSEYTSDESINDAPDAGRCADTAVLGRIYHLKGEPVSCAPAQAGLQQRELRYLHVQQHSKEAASYEQRRTLGFDELARTRSGKLPPNSENAIGLVEARDSDQYISAKDTDVTQCAPKLKKSKSAKSAYRTDYSSESIVPGVDVGFQSSAAEKKSHSILRSASESFGGSAAGKAGRVRFIETPDTIDETGPRLAELKWLSESLVFDSELREGGDNGASKRPGSGGRRRRARQPAVAGSLTDVQAPPKPVRLHLPSEQGDIKSMANGTAENDENGSRSKGLPVGAAAASDAEYRAFDLGVLRDPECPPVDYVSNGAPERPSGMRVSESELRIVLDQGADSHLTEQQQRSAAPKVKSSRRTKLSASDFEPPYASAANDAAKQLLKSRSVGEALSQPVLEASAERIEGDLITSVQPVNDQFYSKETCSEPTIVSYDVLPQHAQSDRNRSRKPDSNGRRKRPEMDIPGSIMDNAEEAHVDREINVSDEEPSLENLEEAAGIANEEHAFGPNMKPTVPIYDIDDHADVAVGEPAEAAVGTLPSNEPTSSRLSRFDIKPIHGSLSGSQQSLSERMGSLRRAARGAIKSLRRAMSLERLSPGSRGSMRASESHGGGEADLPATEAQPAPARLVLINANPVLKTAAEVSPGDNMPKVKKSLSLRSLGKLSFKKRASYDLNGGSGGAQPTVISKNGSSSAQLRASAGSNAVALHWQQALTLPTSQDTSVDHPKNFRAIGKLLELHPDGTRTIQLQRPPHGPFGFYVSRGAIGAATIPTSQASASGSAAVFISRLSDSYPEKLFAGLLAIGDELLEVNRRPVSHLSLDDIHDIMATTTDALLLLVKPVHIQAAG